MKTISEEWKCSFGETPPLGYLCRVDFGDRWLRIHSLPKSKRYPENDLEMQEICRRHNEVATSVLGLNEECILIIGRYSENPNDGEAVKLSGLHQELSPQPELSYQMDEDEDEWMGFWAQRTVWGPGKFDQLIRDIADEKEANALFFNPSKSSVYSPYDGGADLIMPMSELVAPSKERWSSWLSDREDGL
jgi:hypothetical protein